MIYKWNLVKPDVFKDIFDRFWNKQGNTEKLILELQNFSPNDEPGELPIRLFFGQGIQFNDWIDYNKDTYKLIKTTNEYLSSLKGSPVDICKEANLSMCMTEEGPKITPLKSKAEHDELIFKGMIDEDSLDSIVDEKCRMLTKLSRNFLKINIVKTKAGIFKTNGKGEHYVRVRAMDVDDWKEHINHYAENDSFLENFTKDDFII